MLYEVITLIDGAVKSSGKSLCHEMAISLSCFNKSWFILYFFSPASLATSREIKKLPRLKLLDNASRQFPKISSNPCGTLCLISKPLPFTLFV